MDATSLGTLLVGAGAVVGAAVAYLGKKGETALSGHISLIGDLQEERDRLDRKVADLQAENERLRASIVHGQAVIGEAPNLLALRDGSRGLRRARYPSQVICRTVTVLSVSPMRSTANACSVTSIRMTPSSSP